MIAEFLEVTFSRHGTCKLLYDTSLALARSSPTRRYTGFYSKLPLSTLEFSCFSNVVRYCLRPKPLNNYSFHDRLALTV